MNGLELEFPVWTIGKISESGKSVSILRVEDAVHSACAPIFTDTDLAERFRDETIDGRPGNYRVIPIKDSRTLARFVSGLSSIGCQHVVIDFLMGQQHTKVRYVTVSGILSECERPRNE
jgi:hypothetical protein